MPFLAEEHIHIPYDHILSWIFDNISYDWDKPIYIDAANPARTISARQALDAIQRLIAGLKAAGLQQGDCVCVHSFNDICYPIAFLGIVGAGGVFAGTNPAYTSHELAHAIRTADIRFLLAEPELLDVTLSASASCGLPAKNVFVFNPAADPQNTTYQHTPSVPSHNARNAPSPTPAPSPQPAPYLTLSTWHALLAHPPTPWMPLPTAVPHAALTTPAARLFSSGTTGPPKALPLTHANLIAQHTLVMEHPLHAPRRAAAYAIVRLLCTPFFHVSQVPRAHTSALRGGYACVVMRRFELRAWLRAVAAFGVTEVNVVPAMVGAVVSSGLVVPAADEDGNASAQPGANEERHSLRTVRNAWCGAAPMRRELQARFKALLPRATPFTQAWGMSETTGIASFLYWPEQDETGSVGRMLPDVDAKLVDDEGNDISDFNVVGELCVRGPVVVSGYYKNEEADRRDWDAEGFFHTGDVAYCDRETRLWYVVDRKKELIKVRGFQVSPSEIESVLMGHPRVVDAAVVGVSAGLDDTELPRAYVVKKAGAELTEEDVMEFVAGRLAKYKWPAAGVRIVDGVPKNASGKILRKALKERAEREMRGAKL